MTTDPMRHSFGFTAYQRRILEALRDGGRECTSLAASTGLKRSGVLSCVLGLYTRGFVSRQPHGMDARRWVYYLTAAGVDALRAEGAAK